MRIINHDYAGHPFQIQLSKRLAERGHEVLHLYCESTHTPRGDLQRTANDPAGYHIRGISLGQMIPKQSFVQRFKMERRYGALLADACREWRPEVVLSGNTPSLAQQRLAKWCVSSKVRLVSWVQDIYGLAAYRMLRKKLPLVGGLVGRYFISIDKQCAKLSHALVVITEDFTDVYASWGVGRNRLHTIHNWAPLEELPVGERENAWSQRQSLGAGVRFLYSGSLTMRHNPALLLELGRTLQQSGAGELIVVSEGPGVEWLAAEAKTAGLTTIRCLGFQPFADMPHVQASADVLVAILEPDAGVFCVPSKVLTYLCAQRAVLLAVPGENLAARTVRDCGAGLVVEPHDVGGFCRSAEQLIANPAQRTEMAAAARKYAVEHFDIDRIAARFEQILS
jgi:colanic acid biosynthesis glycosyl transferase WcaI